MFFRLSNTQKKELLIRGTPLRIALPAPSDVPANWLHWARRSLMEEGQYVTGVRIAPIMVTEPGGTTLSAVYGTIVHDPQDCDTDAWDIKVVLCNLDPPAKPRHDRLDVQWPLFAEHNGVRWPAIS